MRRLYTLLLYLALPFAVGIMAVRAWRERAASAQAPFQGWPERFGFGARGPAGGIWVHAASVGEIQVAAILIGALKEAEPQLQLSLTCVTPSGRARARELLPQIPARYAPFDLPGSVRRCLARLRPRMLVLIETELWPNLLHATRRAGVPTVIASARVSIRSARVYRRLPGLLRDSLRANVWVAAQTAADAQRFGELGVPPQRLRVIGNLKFDRTLQPDVAARGAALRARYGPARPIWIAGSTHPAEAPIVLAAHRQVLESLPQALLVLAPRHLHRLEQSLAALAASGLRFVRRSSGQSQDGHAAIQTPEGPAGQILRENYQVLVLDTLGELMEFYAAADVAFVGGSLVPVGGHNLLEPAALGLPVLAGPQQFNSPEVARVLREHGGLTLVADAASLGARVTDLLADAESRAQQGARARAALQAHRGALAQVLQLITELVGA